MSVELYQLIATFEDLWPIEGAEDWDAPGLVSGNLNQRISRVLLSVDVTSEIVAEAVDGDFDLLLAHHPFLLRGVQNVAESSAKGALLTKAIRNDVSIYAAHTNADIVEAGVSQVLATALGVSNSVPLVASQNRHVGHGRIGTLGSALKLGDFARAVAKVLPSTAQGVLVSGDYDRPIQTVAVCGGAGDSFIGSARDAGADVYVTADLRHHPALDARDESTTQSKKMALMNVSHWASEWLWLEVAASQLSTRFPNVQFVVSQISSDPWDFVVTQ